LAAAFESLIRESAGRRVSLVHGDWSPKNFLIHGDSVIAIDFEVIHFGDPAFDAAFLLNHLLLKSIYLPQLRKDFAALARAFWIALLAGLPTGADWMEAATVAHLGCLMLARVDGKSPVEYLKDPQTQQTVRCRARDLIRFPPPTLQAVFAW
jgi:5-methylthioribose kinase